MSRDAPKPPDEPRHRNAAATRAAILKSARAAFAEHGYDGAGVREIAAGAGVTAMLVNRYFGSKAALFAEVVVDTMGTPVITRKEVLTAPKAGEEIARALIGVTEKGETPLDGFLVLQRSLANPEASKISRTQIEKHYHKTMTETLAGPHAPERAALMLALVLGVQVMRQTISLNALAKAEPDELTALLTPLFQLLIEGPASG